MDTEAEKSEEDGVKRMGMVGFLPRLLRFRSRPAVLRAGGASYGGQEGNLLLLLAISPAR